MFHLGIDVCIWLLLSTLFAAWQRVHPNSRNATKLKATRISEEVALCRRQRIKVFQIGNDWKKDKQMLHDAFHHLGRSTEHLEQAVFMQTSAQKQWP